MKLGKIILWSFVFIGLSSLGSLFVPTAPELLSESWIARFLLGVMFTSAGAGLLSLLQFGQSRQEDEEKLEAQYPGEPWRWRKDWSKGFSQSLTPLKTPIFLMVGVVFLAVSVPLLLKLPDELAKENWPILISLLFPLAGLAFLVGAVKEKMRTQRYGKSKFYFDSPISLGGALNGRVHVPSRVLRDEKVKVTLVCESIMITGSGKHRRTTTRVLWQEDLLLTGHPEAKGTSFKLETPLPYDLPQWDVSDPKNRIEWKVHANCEVKGVDFSADFQIPVFKTAQSDSSQIQSALRREKFSEEQPSEKSFSADQISGFICRDTAKGLYIETFRGQAKMAGFSGLLFSSIFLAIASGLAVYAFKKDLGFIEPFVWLFPVVFGFFGGLLFAASIGEFFRQTKILLGQNSLQVELSAITHTYLEFPYHEIQKAELTSQNRIGKRAWYDLALSLSSTGEKKHRRPKVIACRIPNKTEAEWLLTQLEKRLTARLDQPTPEQLSA